jgi:Ca-activated chloride channel family protein
VKPEQEILDWWYLNWFTPATFSGFEWGNAQFLFGLILIPLLFLLRWLLGWRNRSKLTVALPQAEVRSNWKTWWSRLIPEFVLALSLILIIIAAARPQRTNEIIEQFTEGIDLILAVDVSASMQLQDLEPNRLEAAKQVAAEFVKNRSHDRIGVVVFAGQAFSLAPLTADHELLQGTLSEIAFGMISEDGTAIGSALAVSTNRLRESESPSKVVILISDGENTAGNLDPLTAAQLANAYDIRIYSIGVGQDGRVLLSSDSSGHKKYVDTRMEESTLREIARLANGSFYRADSKNTLEQVFKEIDRLEKSPVSKTSYRSTSDFYTVYLAWGICFWLLWLLLKSTYLSNALED